MIQTLKCVCLFNTNFMLKESQSYHDAKPNLVKPFIKCSIDKLFALCKKISDNNKTKGYELNLPYVEMLAQVNYNY